MDILGIFPMLQFRVLASTESILNKNVIVWNFLSYPIKLIGF